MEQKNLVDVNKISTAIRMGLPLSVTTYTFPRTVEVYIDSVVSEFLKELHRQEMKDFLIYVINELALNAKKANTKRVYFTEKKLDINNKKDYDLGMKFFKSDTFLNIQHYLQLQKEAGLYIKVVLQYSGNSILLEVRNNSELNKTEFKRIFDKIARSKQYTSLEEVLPKIFDETEGAGLGLIISSLMLQKIGVPNENFYVLVEKGETIMRIVVPMGAMDYGHLNEYSKQITDYIESIPRFPENITRIEKLLNDPESNLSEIADNINTDVALTADLLKLVNSAAFALPQRVINISEAVKLVGLRGIRNLLYSIGTVKILSNSYGEQAKLWSHSYKVAFFACSLARRLPHKQVVADNAYVCGLLHDLGKIVLNLVYPDPDLHNKIIKIKESHHIPDVVFNVVVSEINHPEIGAVLAEKWNFPDSIVSAIRFHHDFENAPEQYKNLVATVSFADMMIHYREQTIEYYQLNPVFLKIFNIDSEVTLQNLCESFEKAFDEDGS